VTRRRRSEVWLRFIEGLNIRTRDRRIAPLRLNGPQRKVYGRIAPKIDRGEPIWLIILKARREGMSTLIESLLFTMCVLNPLVNALVAAHKKKASERIWKMSKLFASSPALRGMASIGSNSIAFGDSLLEVSTAGSPESERSADLTCFHGSEVAFYPYAEALTATLQTIPDKGQTIVVLESTANGMKGDGELFYDEWNRAEAGESAYEAPTADPLATTIELLVTAEAQRNDAGLV